MKRNGFTLIELVVAFALVGILASVAFVALRSSTTAVTKSSAFSILETVTAAEDAHRNTYGSFAGADELQAKGLKPVVGTPVEGEVSIATREVEQVEWVGMAVITGTQCVTRAVSSLNTGEPVEAVYDLDQVICDGSLALEGTE